MASRAKERLQHLIQDIGGGVEYQRPDQQQKQQLLLDTASSASLGLSDQAAESTADTPTGGDGARHNSRRMAQAELEQKVLVLLEERRALEARHEREIRLRDAEVERLQTFVEGELASIRRRQEEVEARAPLVSAQLAEARSALAGDLAVSTERAAQLRGVREDRLGLADAVRLVIHDALQELRSENERLRLAAESAHQGVQRVEAECVRLRRDNARLAANAADRQADVESTIAALEARCSRLSSELEEAAVAVEVLRAKGRQYDELEARADRAESEVARLSAIASALPDMEAQLREVQEDKRELQGRLALSEAERGYLNKEMQVLSDRVSRLESDVAARDSKISDLKRSRAELYQKLNEADSAARRQDDSRLEQELSRLQATAAADKEAVRKEASEAAEHQIRLMREMRDVALDEAARLKPELRDLTAAHESLLASSRDERLAHDVRMAEMLGEARVKALEMMRVTAVSEERGAALQQAKERIELLEEKVRVLTQSALTIEADRSRTAAELQAQLDAAVAQLAQYEAAEMGLGAVGVACSIPTISRGLELQGGGGSGRGGSISPGGEAAAEAYGLEAGGDDAGGPQAGAIRRRPLRALGLQALSARCARLEAEKSEAERSRREAEGKLLRAEADLASVRQQLAVVGQPQRFMLERLAEAEERAVEAEEKTKALQDALSSREQAHAAALEERSALKADLHRLLRERGTLDSLRVLVAGALGKAAEHKVEAVFDP